MNNHPYTARDLDYLLSPLAIRDGAQKVFEMTLREEGHFLFHPEKLQSTVDYVLEVVKKNYPDLNIPFHSRWGHFKVGGTDRSQTILEAKIKHLDPLEKARVKLDLVITSVLLDAGAGADWKYLEESSQKHFSRSEGLGVASLYMFLSGVMSVDGKGLKADSQGLMNVKVQDLEKYFQVNDKNPLVGVEGRVKLLNNLGQALKNETMFKDGRPGNIIDYLIEKNGKTFKAQKILQAVLEGLGTIWPGRTQIEGVNLGDVWFHSELKTLIAFHKLSQWMTYSLIEPMLEAGLQVTGVEELTGLAEYRNGGLIIDSGLISFKNPDEQNQAWSPDTNLIIEWRGLTVYLLDMIGERVQKALKKSPADFPLAKVLEGGTWWAGRFLAQSKRAGGTPPLNIKSDGTVF